MTAGRCPHGMQIGVVRCEVAGCVAGTPSRRVRPDGLRECARCKGAKPADEFYWSEATGTSSRCRVCHRKDVAARMRAKRGQVAS